MERICVLVLTILFTIFQATQASFLYGQPCSDRNTAYLYSDHWTIPDNSPPNCVDVTQFKTPNSINLGDFFRQVSIADTLYADRMNLTRFPTSMVHSLPHVETLDLSENMIRRIPYRMYKIAPKISKMLIPENYIFIPKKRPLLYSYTIRMLMLSRNRIANVYPLTFSGMPNLEILYLDGNNIKCLNSDVFLPVPSLKYLHLGQNQIQEFPPKGLMPRNLRYYITSDQRISKSHANYICEIEELDF